MKRYRINCDLEDRQVVETLGTILGILLPEITVAHVAAPGFQWEPDLSEPGRFKAILGVEGDLSELAASRASVRAEIAAALADLPRFFEVDENGKPVSEEA